jgi:hypothetical protein
MPYSLCDHIYVTQFRDDLILLDLRRDRYLTFSQELSDLLMDLLEEKKLDSDNSRKFYSGTHFSTNNLHTIQKLIDDKIIEEKTTLFPFYIDRKVNSGGVSNVDWRLPLENKKVRFNKQVLKALTTLLQVNFTIKVRGFYPAIQLIKKSCKSQSNYIIPPMEDLRKLANIVNKACLIYPTRTKCLEWAITFVLLALKRKWKCNLEIGVQNYPFMAHAWVECDGKVVMDDQDLREGLAIILNEPFRKLKT